MNIIKNTFEIDIKKNTPKYNYNTKKKKPNRKYMFWNILSYLNVYNLNN